MQKNFSLFIALLVGLLLVTGRTVWATPGYYLSPAQVDLVRILPPPPPITSVKGKADLQAVLAAQRNLTEVKAEEVRADAKESVFRFADVLGPKFNSGNLPFASDFFRRVSSDADEAVDVAKTHFDRTRPFVVDRNIKPIVGRPTGPSYPGGHATFAYLDAILLAYMVPEKAPALFDRAARYAQNRVIGGVHYPTDSRAGQISASVIANVLLHEPRFLRDLNRARHQVRKTLRLPQRSAESTPRQNDASQGSRHKVTIASAMQWKDRVGGSDKPLRLDRVASVHFYRAHPRD